MTTRTHPPPMMAHQRASPPLSPLWSRFLRSPPLLRAWSPHPRGVRVSLDDGRPPGPRVRDRAHQGRRPCCVHACVQPATEWLPARPVAGPTAFYGRGRTRPVGTRGSSSNHPPVHSARFAALHLATAARVPATHRKSSPGGHAHTTSPDFKNPSHHHPIQRDSPARTTKPIQSPAEKASHGDPVLRRRVPPLRRRRRPARRRAGAQAPARPGGRAGRGGRGRRDKPRHQEGGGEGGRHRPHRRARQAAHRLLPVRTAHHRFYFFSPERPMHQDGYRETSGGSCVGVF